MNAGSRGRGSSGVDGGGAVGYMSSLFIRKLLRGVGGVKEEMGGLTDGPVRGGCHCPGLAG